MNREKLVSLVKVVILDTIHGHQDLKQCRTVCAIFPIDTSRSTSCLAPVKLQVLLIRMSLKVFSFCLCICMYVSGYFSSDLNLRRDKANLICSLCGLIIRTAVEECSMGESFAFSKVHQEQMGQAGPISVCLKIKL